MGAPTGHPVGGDDDDSDGDWETDADDDDEDDDYDDSDSGDDLLSPSSVVLTEDLLSDDAVE